MFHSPRYRAPKRPVPSQRIHDVVLNWGPGTTVTLSRVTGMDCAASGAAPKATSTRPVRTALTARPHCGDGTMLRQLGRRIADHALDLRVVGKLLGDALQHRPGGIGLSQRHVGVAAEDA